MSLSHTTTAISPLQSGGLAARTWRKFMRKKLCMLSLLYLAVVIVSGTAMYLFSTEHTGFDLMSRLLPPGSIRGGSFYLLGSDYLGRDVFQRLVLSGCISLSLASAAVVLSAIVGGGLGLVAGYYRGSADSIIMRLVDIQLAFPFVLMTIVILGVFGTSVTNILTVFVIASWPVFARTVRASVLMAKERSYLDAAVTLGASDRHLIVRHIIPNCLSSLLVVASYEVARIILLESSLGFLGLGIQPPTPTWGNMLGEGRQYITTAWWIVTFPGLAIMLTVASVNLVGDGLNDALDIKAK